LRGKKITEMNLRGNWFPQSSHYYNENSETT